MLKHIYPVTLSDGRTCGFALEQHRADFLSAHPDASPCDPIRVTAQQFVEWKATGSWEEGWGNGRFIEASSLPRWGVDIRDPEPPSPRHFALAWAQIPNYSDRAAYISDLALSSMWGDDAASEIPAERIDYLGRLWDAANMDVKSICRAANLTQAQLAARFGIPKRTVEDWCRGVSKCAPYIRMMMMECLGLIEYPTA